MMANEHQGLTWELFNQVKETIAINVQHIVRLISEDPKRFEKQRSRRRSLPSERAKRWLLKTEQHRAIKDAVTTATRTIAVNFEELAALQVLKRSFAELSRTREEGLLIKTQRQGVDQRIEQKMQERLALCREQKILVQGTVVEVSEMIALDVELAKETGRMEEELAALEMRKRIRNT